VRVLLDTNILAKDWPIWLAAKTLEVDLLITGDKDFLEAGLTDPRILAPSQFLAAAGA
jgi:predicted nucleic acid-binding protein